MNLFFTGNMIALRNKKIGALKSETMQHVLQNCFSRLEISVLCITHCVFVAKVPYSMQKLALFGPRRGNDL